MGEQKISNWIVGNRKMQKLNMTKKKREKERETVWSQYHEYRKEIKWH